MYAATATKSLLRHANFIHVYLDPENYTDMNVEPAEHRHLLFCNLGKGRQKKQHILQNVKTSLSL